MNNEYAGQETWPRLMVRDINEHLYAGCLHYRDIMTRARACLGPWWGLIQPNPVIQH